MVARPPQEKSGESAKLSEKDRSFGDARPGIGRRHIAIIQFCGIWMWMPGNVSAMPFFWWERFKTEIISDFRRPVKASS